MRTFIERIEWLTKPWDPAVVRSLMVLAFVLVLGTAGYTWIEGWSPWKSLFFTLVTVTTVGYGDYGLSPDGERFTALVMVGGIGTVSFAISQLLTSTVARTLHPEKRMLQRAKQLRDHHIVCGYGRMGQRVAQRLRDQGAACVVIDDDEEKIDQARADGHIAIAGDATEDQTLAHAGIEHASTLAAISSSDAINALICLTANAVAPDLTLIARAEQSGSICKLHRAGAQRVISPSASGADGVAQHMLNPEAARVVFGCDSDTGINENALAFSEIVVAPGSGLAGTDVRTLGERHPDVVFVATAAPGEAMIMRPAGSHVLREGEVIVVAGAEEGLRVLNGRRAA